MRVISLATIKAKLPVEATIEAIERGFVAYSNNAVTVPPVGHLALPGGDCHIKYGYIHGDDFFVVKIASGFHNNAQQGLATGSGMMLLLDAKTGLPQALLEDEGYLTDIRTAMAGLIAARYLAPKNIHCIGVIGCGQQARYQLQYLRYHTDCRRCIVWGRNQAQLEAYCQDVRQWGFEATIAQSPQQVARASNLIITSTPSTEAILRSQWIQPGTHITAMGADTPGKQELDTALLVRADVIVVDSISQCSDHGEVHKAVQSGLISATQLTQLGHVIDQTSAGRTTQTQITIADLTGVAVQDIQIATAVYRACLST